MVGRSAVSLCRRLTDRTADAPSCVWCQQLRHSNPLRGQSPRRSAKRDKYSTGWSTQRDRHGAYTACYSVFCVSFTTFRALTLLVGHADCKETEWWYAGMVRCLGQGADLHKAQLMPLSLTTSCSSKFRLVLPFWCRLTQVDLDKIQQGRKTVTNNNNNNNNNNNRLMALCLGLPG